MKKSASVLLALVLTGGAYTASAWYLGKNVEAQVDQGYSNLLASQPYLKIVQRDYQRGIFASEETVTLAFNNLPGTAGAADSGTGKPLELTFHSLVKHGPVPGFSGLGAAVSDTELVLSDEARSQLSHFLGDKPPYTQHTVIHFDGSGTAHFSSPGFETSFNAPSGQAQQVAWDGIEGSVDFTPDAKSFILHMQAPKLALSGDEGKALIVKDFNIDGDQQQIFNDLPYMYSGKMHLSFGELTARDDTSQTPPVTIKQLVYDVELPVQGDYLDLVAKIGTQNLSVGQDSIGPMHMDFSFRHLQARAVAEMNQKLMALYSDPSLQGSTPEQLIGQFQVQLKQYIADILANDPQFNIDRVSIANPNGEAQLAAQVRLVGATLEELANPVMMLARLEATGDISLSEAMIVQLLRNPPFTAQAVSELSPEEIEARGQVAAEQFLAQVAALTEQGYINRDQDLIKTSLAFKGGELTVNGKPFSPMALQR